tara:strand:+ start:725 stop:883 length:159 start_codon:yes stop_codon:yes gene_type:complete
MLRGLISPFQPTITSFNSLTDTLIEHKKGRYDGLTSTFNDDNWDITDGSYDI